MTNTSRVRSPSARWASAMSDSTPPSPLLSARMTKSTYLTVTTMISAHSARLTTPSTEPRDIRSCMAWPMAALKA